MLPVMAILVIAMIAGFFLFVVPGVLMAIVCFLFGKGFFVLQPNEAMVLVLFGKYIGTVRDTGFWWANPLAVKSFGMKSNGEGQTAEFTRGNRITLRLRNFLTETIKVNDARGNPIEIGGVVVWRVSNTAAASFEVDDYVNYVHIQSETAVRHLASLYPYDHISDDDSEGGLTLRQNGEEICEALRKELHDRLSQAGVEVIEARVTHLAYAPEIAGAMLRRQQAEAVIAARRKIVTGAVSMVEMALAELDEKAIVELDSGQKAKLVSNLLLVLCGESDVEPVLPMGMGV
jgi:regulator of protease activity HflC (stomatin/prohibitin superfamily)